MHPSLLPEPSFDFKRMRDREFTVDELFDRGLGQCHPLGLVQATKPLAMLGGRHFHFLLTQTPYIEMSLARPA